MQIHTQSQRVTKLLFGEQFLEKFNQTSLLLIGVGGIGCEVLKNLSQFKFKEIHILDLDTIEVSNLNRQFLFRKSHRGHYKSEVAKQVLEYQKPFMNLKSHTKNIKDEQYGLKFFSQFNLVIMALDNQETRSFVNKQCMILDIPLLEAGTTGYKGQAYIFKRGQSRCYDCFPKTENKQSYPACTIRTLPEKPVHCIIWAKYLFNVIFNEKIEENDESNLLLDIQKRLEDNKEDENDKENGEKLFEQIFLNDVLKQKEEKKDLQFLQSIQNEEIYASIFIASFDILMKQKRKNSCVIFEKDDDICIKFITAATNLRCIVFNLPLQTQFQVKEIAGNIVPAIASTNSIVSAIQISEAIKYFQRKFFQNDYQDIQNRELYIQNESDMKILDTKQGKSNENCLSCNVNLIPDIVYCDFNKTNLGQFLDRLFNENGELQNFSINFCQFIIYENTDFQEEEEIENRKIQKVKPLFQIFKNFADARISIMNEDDNQIFCICLLVHIENSQEITFKKQNRNMDSLKINWKNIVQKTQEEKQKEPEKVLFKNNENNGLLEILESESASDQDLIFCDNNNENIENKRKENQNKNEDDEVEEKLQKKVKI
ncbi:ubiquitin-activating enzyme e1, putative [Ichthyophthirius multifiliis]|uniref:SUMO-activating enzyme subunit n=1 Tax=Ichthyophthirius multifiliis TaxID=5932 RepID=G0QVU2_ICHMU|nr:ubiquitin-activating enzyme e1, putative [Ichthyophthirius multifiliis]EGR30664.1 ubiquitin-activating enzyme e1, putative [Ichthyophthirius multifiliis]|eukprot:XP_004032251.1 ubiquitin-activating enzyme e1, putative [Ichthyophthirius multifiliis]